MTQEHLLDTINLGKIVSIRDQVLSVMKSGQPVYRFESGDPSFNVPQHIIEAFKNALWEGKTHYVANTGIPELRTAIMEKLNKKNNMNLTSPESIFITNGGMNAIHVAFKALLYPQDEVIIPDPMWTEISHNIKLSQGIPVPIPISLKHPYKWELTSIESKITSHTKGIYINSPHNPTGIVLPRENLQEIINLAKKYDLWVFSDEAYEDICYAPHKHYSPAALAPEYSHKIISVFTFSKSHAMSGLRVGYIVTTDPALQIRIPKQLRCTINGVNSASQWAALAAINGDQSHIKSMRDEYEYRGNLLYEALDQIDGIIPIKPQGSFFIWTYLEKSLLEKTNSCNALEFSNYLAKNGIGSIPGETFSSFNENTIRFAYSCDTQMVKDGIISLKKACNGIDSI